MVRRAAGEWESLVRSRSHPRSEATHRKARRGLTTAIALFVLMQTGCGAIKWQQPSWDKPVGKGTWIPALICGAIGGGVGVAIQNERAGSSTVICTGSNCPDPPTQRQEDDKDLWKGAVIGAPIGMVLCGILGHVFLDPPPEEPLPPPPPVIPTPEPAPVVKRRIVLRGVNFDFDSSAIRPDARPVLDHAATILLDQSDVRVLVAGYTDSTGSDEYNLKLSVRRAEAVYRYLVNHGVDPENMTVRGHGEADPVASNENESGRAQNRRVELQVLP